MEGGFSFEWKTEKKTVLTSLDGHSFDLGIESLVIYDRSRASAEALLRMFSCIAAQGLERMICCV